MKRYRLHIWPVWLLLGMMFLAACQSDALPGENSGGAQQTTARSDSSYINLRIVNSNAAMTRATEAATAAENAVYDGILCIFEGADEVSATLKTATVIDQLINNPGNSATVEITQRFATGTHAYGTKLYVLALLNTTSTGFKVSGNDLLFDDSSQKNKTISQIQNLVIHSVGSTKEHVGLFMSNAPQNGYIMPEIPSNCLYDTETLAATGNRLTINVERAAARVKVTNAATQIRNIRLNPRNGDSETRHPNVHKITWSLNHYNTQSYAIRTGFTAEDNWATSINNLTSFTAKDFSLYPQQSYSQDAVYIGENTTETETEVIVKVQLKDNSNMLMHECFVFHPYQNYYIENANQDLFTSPEQYIAYLRDELPPENKGWFGLAGTDNAEIFKYATVKIDANGNVVFSLKNSDFTPEQQESLNEFAAFLSNHTTGFRDGKMYYTYKINHDTTHGNGVVRNNAYNLTFVDNDVRQSMSAIGRPKP